MIFMHNFRAMWVFIAYCEVAKLEMQVSFMCMCVTSKDIAHSRLNEVRHARDNLHSNGMPALRDVNRVATVACFFFVFPTDGPMQETCSQEVGRSAQEAEQLEGKTCYCKESTSRAATWRASQKRKFINAPKSCVY